MALKSKIPKRGGPVMIATPIKWLWQKSEHYGIVAVRCIPQSSGTEIWIYDVHTLGADSEDTWTKHLLDQIVTDHEEGQSPTRLPALQSTAYMKEDALKVTIQLQMRQVIAEQEIQGHVDVATHERNQVMLTKEAVRRGLSE